MTSQPAHSARERKIYANFMRALKGETKIRSAQEAKLFLEAIVTQNDPVACVEKIISTTHGIHAFQTALHGDTSTTQLNSCVSKLLKYIQADNLALAGGGVYLQQIIRAFSQPAIVWNALLAAHKARQLDDEAMQGFAWLLQRLLYLPEDDNTTYRAVGTDPKVTTPLLESTRLDIRMAGQKIKHICETTNRLVSDSIDIHDAPGGRHDNDHHDITQINLLPTPDEVLSTEPPFLRRAFELDQCTDDAILPSMYLDNHFRLLREDFVRELRDDLQVANNPNKGYRKTLVLNNLHACGIQCTSSSPQNADKQIPWMMKFVATKGLPQLYNLNTKQRQKFIVENRNFVKHESLASLVCDEELAALVTIYRDEELLSRKHSIISVRISGASTIEKALTLLKTAKQVSLIQLNSAIFAYEPVLKRLQSIREIPLADDILFWNTSKTPKASDLLQNDKFAAMVSSLHQNPQQDLQALLQLKKSVRLDASQGQCLIAGLTQSVSLIQGPPGTGKSFIGALAAKALYDNTKQRILVVCYTNHALDQFLEDLLAIGIKHNDIVRLGSAKKASAAVQSLHLSKQNAANGLGRDAYNIINSKKSSVATDANQLGKAFNTLAQAGSAWIDLLGYLEFEDLEHPFYSSFSVPEEGDGMQKVGRKGRTVRPEYLIRRWAEGRDAGIYPEVAEEFPMAWSLPLSQREAFLAQWHTALTKDLIHEIYITGKRHDDNIEEVQRLWSQKNASILQSKRIIGCTTTAAAKYSADIQAASPQILLIEEAGEILESHILTAMTPATKQLILIGDHKQLRPKANWNLSVEKGDGYDLNRSLFERLVLKGFPHQVLSQQHRMRPEISNLVRQLTYPDLTDAPETSTRPRLLGFTDNLIFVNHEHLEDEVVEEPDWKSMSSKSSKKNSFEAEMILKCVKYLGQQGYGTDDIVILTPYLGQLSLLMTVLSRDNDPVLNDLDSYDLVQAGLMPAETAKLSKKQINISTIDNYQGQESKVVLVSLTRSNAGHDIGFMADRNRLNVLLSRARDSLIMVGNAPTFLGSRKGGEVWEQVIDMLKEGSHIYNGFPLVCERHPEKTLLISEPTEFDSKCPDGGCLDPCGADLSCKIHKCPSRCHQLFDHSKMPCHQILDFKCALGHTNVYKCSEKKPGACKTCIKQQEEKERRQKAAFALQEKRAADQARHDVDMAKLDEEIKQERAVVADKHASDERRAALEQKRKDLASARQAAIRAQSPLPAAARVSTPTSSTSSAINSTPSSRSSSPTPPAPTAAIVASSAKVTSPSPSSPPTSRPDTPSNPTLSPSEAEWARQKRVEGASNDAIDKLMAMTGLEGVKSQVLMIKGRIETARRQGTDMKKERIGCMLLGNPGTGKTTVARLYAEFLASIDILPGSEFVETTGSRLANDGVAGVKQQIENIVSAGGGAYFLDEAYQLVEGHNYGGKSVLDFLLAEMENQTGKIVFLVAGYSTQMEAFLAHNPGLSSRIPYTLQFGDYTDAELLSMFGQLVSSKYDDKMKVEGGLAGLYARILIRRLGRGRAKVGFGNARALQNVFAKVAERQSDRLHSTRVAGGSPDDFLLTKEDMIGPEPSGALAKSSAWKEVQSMIGLASVKNSIQSMVDRIRTNYTRELKEQPPIQISLNKVFLGSPGTGKTSIGKLYGQILVDLGLLSSNEVLMKNPSDFVGDVLGASEKNTKAILAASEGKVLIIDEAYMLASSSGNGADPYKTAVVDVIVAEVQSTPSEDRCVLLLGYKEQLEEMMHHANPGLARRFPLSDAFTFEDFSEDELAQILDLKLKKQELDATPQAKQVAMAVLCRAKARPHFGNAGEVENLISRAKSLQQQRVSAIPFEERPEETVFEPQDFDPDFDRSSRAGGNLEELFKDVIGCEGIVEQLRGYQKVAAVMRNHGRRPEEHIPMHFVFKGPPGTGKTTTARKLGQVFYDMGFLSSTEVIECSATDLIGTYVGQTGPKTVNQLELALGKVLFIDEAYRLGEGNFATEAISELVDSLTKPRFMNKLIVILAGYEDDMNSLMSINQGLSSRFPEEVIFTNLEPSHCFTLLQKTLFEVGIVLEGVEEGSDQRLRVLNLFASLATLQSWGNGRDVKTVANSITQHVFKTMDENATSLTASPDLVIRQLSRLLATRQSRERVTRKAHSPLRHSQRQQEQRLPPLTQPAPFFATKTAVAEPPPVLEDGGDAISIDSGRDLNVTEATWQQLQHDIKAAADAERRQAEQAATLEQQAEDALQDEVDAAEELLHLEANTAADDDAKRRHEAARLKRVAAMRAKAEAEDELERLKQQIELAKQEERKVQVKLREMGLCVAGFRWIKQAGGYRCAGGSHFVGNERLGI